MVETWEEPDTREARLLWVNIATGGRISEEKNRSPQRTGISLESDIDYTIWERGRHNHVIPEKERPMYE